MPSLPNISSYALAGTLNTRDLDVISIDADNISCNSLVVGGTTFTGGTFTDINTKTQNMTGTVTGTTKFDGAISIDTIQEYTVGASTSILNALNVMDSVRALYTGTTTHVGFWIQSPNLIFLQNMETRIGTNVALSGEYFATMFTKGVTENSGSIKMGNTYITLFSNSATCSGTGGTLLTMNTATPQIDIAGNTYITGSNKLYVRNIEIYSALSTKGFTAGTSQVSWVGGIPSTNVRKFRLSYFGLQQSSAAIPYIEVGDATNWWNNTNSIQFGGGNAYNASLVAAISHYMVGTIKLTDINVLTADQILGQIEFFYMGNVNVRHTYFYRGEFYEYNYTTGAFVRHGFYSGYIYSTTANNPIVNIRIMAGAGTFSTSGYATLEVN